MEGNESGGELEDGAGDESAGEEGAGDDSAGEEEVAPLIGQWAEACFPSESRTTETEVKELLREAAEAARDENNAASAVA